MAKCTMNEEDFKKINTEIAFICTELQKSLDRLIEYFGESENGQCAGDVFFVGVITAIIEHRSRAFEGDSLEEFLDSYYKTIRISVKDHKERAKFILSKECDDDN